MLASERKKVGKNIRSCVLCYHIPTGRFTELVCSATKLGPSNLDLRFNTVGQHNDSWPPRMAPVLRLWWQHRLGRPWVRVYLFIRQYSIRIAIVSPHIGPPMAPTRPMRHMNQWRRTRTLIWSTCSFPHATVIVWLENRPAD